MNYRYIHSAVASKVSDGIAYRTQTIAEERDRAEALRIVRGYFSAPLFDIPPRDSEVGRALMFIGELISEQPEDEAAEPVQQAAE